MSKRGNLIVILGDQLSENISSLRDADKASDWVLMAEVDAEASYVPHHKKKIAFLFSAMRHFAQQLKDDGWYVDYVRLDAPGNSGNLTGEVIRAASVFSPARIIATEPGEWRVRQLMEEWEDASACPVDILEDDRFVCSHTEFLQWADGKKALRMEFFYREMRKKTGILMDGDKPEGGKWNFDASNRRPANAGMQFPEVFQVSPDKITSEVLALVDERFGAHFGDLEPFWFGVTRENALSALDHFVEKALPQFGDYQDAMLTGQRFLFHSLLSLYLNAGLLNPLEICRRVENAYYSGHAPVNAAEGFIRQILGWREYVRGIYWLKMPGYVTENFFDHKRKLPKFYWSSDTRMACMRSAITQTKEEAYAHHIQRLMITGNFALLVGIDPHDVHEWYLAVYADAYEWVELPNTLGMSQFADGGLLGSKPYVSSGNYIHKMSDYCKNCDYDVKKKTGDGVCPFNSLYWNFLYQNRSRLMPNQRLSQVYRVWDNMDERKQMDYLTSAQGFLDKLDSET